MPRRTVRSLFRSSRRGVGRIFRSLGASVANAVNSPAAPVAAIIGVAGAVGDAIMESNTLLQATLKSAAAVPAVIVFLNLTEYVRQRKATRIAEERATEVPERPPEVANPRNPDLILVLNGGAMVRGVGAEQDTQYAAMLRDEVQTRVAEELGMPDLRVAVVNTLTNAQATSPRLESHAEGTKALVRKNYPGRVHAASVVAPDTVDIYNRTPATAENYLSLFGTISAGTSSSIFDRPSVVITPHIEPAAHWMLHGYNKSFTGRYGDGIEKMATNFNTGRAAQMPQDGIELVSVFRADKFTGLKPEHFDPRNGNNLNAEGQRLMATQTADILVPVILDDLRRSVPQTLEPERGRIFTAEEIQRRRHTMQEPGNYPYSARVLQAAMRKYADRGGAQPPTLN